MFVSACLRSNFDDNNIRIDYCREYSGVVVGEHTKLGNPRKDDFRHDNAMEVEKEKFQFFVHFIFIITRCTARLQLTRYVSDALLLWQIGNSVMFTRAFYEAIDKNRVQHIEKPTVLRVSCKEMLVYRSFG